MTKAPAHGDRHGLSGKATTVYRGGYVTTPRVSAKVPYRSIACTSCGAGVGDPCVAKSGPRAGQPTSSVHPERSRMAIRLRNEAIARGEEEVVTQPPGDQRGPLKVSRYGEKDCPQCGCRVPVIKVNIPLVGIPRGTLVLTKHTAEGYAVSLHRNDVPCLGSHTVAWPKE